MCVKMCAAFININIIVSLCGNNKDESKYANSIEIYLFDSYEL